MLYFSLEHVGTAYRPGTCPVCGTTASTSTKASVPRLTERTSRYCILVWYYIMKSKRLSEPVFHKIKTSLSVALLPIWTSSELRYTVFVSSCEQLLQ